METVLFEVSESPKVKILSIGGDLRLSGRESVQFADGDSLTEVALDSERLGKFVYYYVRVTCASGAQAWSSPVWLVQG